MNVNNKKMAAKKGASYLEEIVAGWVVRAGVSGIFRMNHRFALTMMGYAPNHCAAGYERILRTVCLRMKLKKPSAAPISASTKKLHDRTDVLFLSEELHFDALQG